ncbi:hypothetical protein JHK85_001247 [Glycine max]|nr:hypothetical protein JHK87_001224 [Glycine soja]KAG5068870.1 hypothetical protein JHK85_001247 [Glycine max]KAG5088603.1 hypothetical protein JHK86_001215 [Glycine max]
MKTITSSFQGMSNQAAPRWVEPKSMDSVCPIGFHCATEISALLTPPSPLQVQVDCDEHKSLCSKYGVSGYPTIQWFPKGSLEPKKYEGPRTADSLAEFVNTEGGTA